MLSIHVIHNALFSLTIVCCLLWVEHVQSHPQCLDYRPPFQAKRRLPFCSTYSKFGCCTAKQASKIARRFHRLKGIFSLQNRVRCTKLLEQVLCLECDPYAAHIFEAEGNTNFNAVKATPGLCPDFCIDFYNACPDIVSFYVKKGKWIFREKSTALTPSATPSTLASTPNVITQTSTSKTAKTPAKTFCAKLQIQDVDYCYPDVKKIEEIVLARKYNKDQNRGCLCAEEVASGLRNPLAAVHSGDGTHRLFIAEQIGVVHVLLPTGRKLTIPFLDITRKVLVTKNYGDERGLLSIAFHPNYERNGRFYVYYSTRLEKNKHKNIKDEPFRGYGHKTVLSEFLVSPVNPNRADPDSERVILEVPQPFSNHNGGQILFGFEGYLYLTLGDGGRGGDPFGHIGNGQNKSTLLGSILRIDINTRDGSPYRIPRGNPFRRNRHVRPEIYAYGVRNVWRCSIDRGDKTTREGRGRMFCGDVGQNKYEEIDIIQRAGNYGWRGFEGFECFDRKLCYTPMLSNAIPPIHVYNHSVGKSILGGYVYRGCQNPKLYGQYIFGDTWSSRFFSLVKNKTTRRWDHRELCFGDNNYCTDKLRGDFEQFVLSFGEDEAGELYILATPSPLPHSPKGKVYRLVDPERRGNPAECAFSPKTPTVRRHRPTPVPRPSKPCEDRLGRVYKVSHRTCQLYKNRGMCKSGKFFKQYCRKSCGFCDLRNKRPKKRKRCIDRLMVDYKVIWTTCAQYSDRGMCRKGRFFKKYCRKTCGFCK